MKRFIQTCLTCKNEFQKLFQHVFPSHEHKFLMFGLYAFKLLVEDLIGLMGCFHPSPKRRKIPFRLSMNLCEICVVFFCVDGKAVWVLGSLPCSYIHSILFMPRYGGGIKAIVYFRLKILCYNIYMFGCCFYIGMGRNFSFSLPGSKNIF